LDFVNADNRVSNFKEWSGEQTQRGPMQARFLTPQEFDELEAAMEVPLSPIERRLVTDGLDNFNALVNALAYKLPAQGSMVLHELATVVTKACCDRDNEYWRNRARQRLQQIRTEWVEPSF
jgi:hypothetical protein